MIQNLFCFFVQEFQYETRKSNGKSGNRKSLKWFNPSIWYYSFSCCKSAALLQAICLSGRLKILYQPTTSNCLGHVKASDDEIVGDSFPTDQSFQVGYFSPIPSVPLLIESIDHNSGWPVTLIVIEEWNILRSFFHVSYLPGQYPPWLHRLVIFLNQSRLNYLRHPTTTPRTRKTFLSES